MMQEARRSSPVANVPSKISPRGAQSSIKARQTPKVAQLALPAPPLSMIRDPNAMATAAFSALLHQTISPSSHTQNATGGLPESHLGGMSMHGALSGMQQMMGNNTRELANRSHLDGLLSGTASNMPLPGLGTNLALSGGGSNMPPSRLVGNVPPPTSTNMPPPISGNLPLPGLGNRIGTQSPMFDQRPGYTQHYPDAGDQQPMDVDAADLANDVEFQHRIESYIEKIQTQEGTKLRCKACNKLGTSKAKVQMVVHVESVHLQAVVACQVCKKEFKARSYLTKHLKRGKCGGIIGGLPPK